MPLQEPVPTALVELVELFERELSQAKFPGVDAASLRAALDRTSEARQAVALAEEQFVAARATLESQRQQFVAHARLAMRYAQIFAQDDPSLASTLDELNTRADADSKTPRKRKTPPERKRGRRVGNRVETSGDEAGVSVARGVGSRGREAAGVESVGANECT